MPDRRSRIPAGWWLIAAFAISGAAWAALIAGVQSLLTGGPAHG